MRKLLLYFFILGSPAASAQLYWVSEELNAIYQVNLATNTLVSPVALTDGRAGTLSSFNNGTVQHYHSGITSGSNLFLNNNTSVGSFTLSIQSSTHVLEGTAINALQEIYGISNFKKLIKVYPAGTAERNITGDAFWSASTTILSGDSYFDDAGKLNVIAHDNSSPRNVYLYSIDVSSPTPQAVQGMKLSGTLPTFYDGVASYNGKIYISETNAGYVGNSTNSPARYYVNLYEVSAAGAGRLILNPEMDQRKSARNWNNDLSAVAVAPICSELYGVVGAGQTIQKINLTNPPTLTLFADGPRSNYDNLALGPVPGNPTVNQFVSSNTATGTIDLLNPPFATFTTTGYTSSSPRGTGTHPVNGMVYGINNKTLTRFDGASNALSLGTIGGDLFWRNGTVLSDVAVSSSGLLYTLVTGTFKGTPEVWLYRITPTQGASTAVPVIKLSGDIPNLNSSRSQGFAFVGDRFYYSQTDGTINTEIWRLNGLTGNSTRLGLINGLITDLASCSDITTVYAKPCYQSALTEGDPVPSQVGITTLGRAGADNGNWPMSRNGAHLVLESNTKGMVLNRLSTAQIDAIVSPAEGMMVYDTTENCTKIYVTGTLNRWKCLQTQSCPE